MARFETDGLDAMIEEMHRMQQLTGHVARAVLQAGAEGVKKAWKLAAEEHGLRDTGDMIESIGFAREPKSAGDVKFIDIYPQGTDRKGVRNAEKAFILHYGHSKADPTYWVDDADAYSADFAVPAMEEVWAQFLATGEVPQVELTPNKPSGHNGTSRGKSRRKRRRRRT
jgi:hypothetical protein